MKQRRIAWFSCGAASACAAKLSLEYFPGTQVVYCDTMATEHPDNRRFFADVEKWLGVPINVIRSKKFSSVDEVFTKERYMAGPRGAKCTVEMKKVPRFEFQEADDIHVFGYTHDEFHRIQRFIANNPELYVSWPLMEQGMTKQDCLDMIQKAGIELPMMYRLGFRNNNCIGCVKSTSPTYWNRVREHFPEIFQRRIEQSRGLSVRLVQLKGKRIFLDELPKTAKGGAEASVECGPQCGSGY